MKATHCEDKADRKYGSARSVVDSASSLKLYENLCDVFNEEKHVFCH